MSNECSDKTNRIRELNDSLRRALTGGRIQMTSGVSGLGPERIAPLFSLIRTFDDFSPENDPYGEHDFGAFSDESGQKYFWKIDYYDLSLNFHSEDAADPSKTIRVLTLMLSEEY